MLKNLREKLSTRRAVIASSSYKDLLTQSWQFFAFLDSNPVLKSMTAELLARNQQSIREATTTAPHKRVAGETTEKAAAIGLVKWRAFANQDDPRSFYVSSEMANGIEQAAEFFKEWYVNPVFLYFEETLGDFDVILALLIRYKHKVEWYRRKDVLDLYAGKTATGEDNVKQHMFEYLFDQGLQFHKEPSSASGQPDAVILDDSGRPLITEAKIFTGQNKPSIKDGFYQAYWYCVDYSESLGYLIVFNVSDRQLEIKIESDTEGIPRWTYNHKTIFVVQIDVHPHEETASGRGISDTVTITEDELRHEVEELGKARTVVSDKRS